MTAPTRQIRSPGEYGDDPNPFGRRGENSKDEEDELSFLDEAPGARNRVLPRITMRGYGYEGMDGFTAVMVSSVTYELTGGALMLSRAVVDFAGEGGHLNRTEVELATGHCHECWREGVGYDPQRSQRYSLEPAELEKLRRLVREMPRVDSEEVPF